MFTCVTTKLLFVTVVIGGFAGFIRKLAVTFDWFLIFPPLGTLVTVT